MEAFEGEQKKHVYNFFSFHILLLCEAYFRNLAYFFFCILFQCIIKKENFLFIFAKLHYNFMFSDIDSCIMFRFSEVSMSVTVTEM